jgi:hypothetical protein
MMTHARLLAATLPLLLARPLAAADLPDSLATADGSVVTTAEAWRNQVRPQTLRIFREQVYGVRPVGKPADFAAKVTRVDPQALDGMATLKAIEITYSGPHGIGRIHPVVITPNAAKKPAPAFLLINFNPPDPLLPKNQNGAWPVREIIARGYATASFDFTEVDPDRPDGFKDGVRALFANNPDDPQAWGALSAWGWAASRVLDYLETDPAINAKRVAVIGHSRAGKAALWCGAEDERFSLVISNNSGCAGAAISRTKRGESIANITSRFPYWFCLNYRKYAGKENDLPVDQHQLLGLIAPRLLYVASATDDAWADPQSEFQSAVLAGRVYALFGRKGLDRDTVPPPDQPLSGGAIGYHIRAGKHALTLADWRHYLDFADQHD